MDTARTPPDRAPGAQKRAAATALLLGLALLAGCATPDGDARLRPGHSDQAQIVALYGEPTRIWPEADGGRTLEYASQPFGQTCYMLRLGADGRLQSVTDVLRDEAARFAAITPGMSPEQVSRSLGRERSRVFFRFSGEEVWDWNVPPAQNGYLLRFNVHFKDGHVLRTTQSVEYPMLDDLLP